MLRITILFLVMAPTQPTVTPSPPLGQARVPRNCRVYAIGDIHGRADLLERMVSMIMDDAENAKSRRNIIVFLGDYIDRGPESFEVIDLLAAGPPPGFEAYFLKGNHEDYLLRYLEDGRNLKDWLANGGDATLVSYGLDPLNCSVSALKTAVPDNHLAFYKSLKSWHREGDYLFVHAGLHPELPLENQREVDMIWIRGKFLNFTGSFGFLVVHGHSIHPEPDVCDNRIGIDTGAYESGRLTCLVLEGTDYRFLTT